MRECVDLENTLFQKRLQMLKELGINQADKDKARIVAQRMSDISERRRAVDIGDEDVDYLIRG